ncbi:hypothetical protein K8F61_13725 [Microbacterium resistens]|uniref:PIN domain-containing protein n=1 Tax=Microbacterium resistens TaxID=156977 RepID=A0ABY3RRY9_9MICO|nr:PIN domain-containing protein [Microbacterium resistens]UGS25715.1 hypothetical protein K8F61_13725 [Microbacterium resistens]
MILLDTNVLIRLKEITLPDAEICVSAISLAEMRFGVDSARTPAVRRQRLRQLVAIDELMGHEWMPFEDRAASGTGFLASVVAATRPSHARSRDIMLAGHAYALGAALLTLNPRDFALVSEHVEILAPDRPVAGERPAGGGSGRG